MKLRRLKSRLPRSVSLSDDDLLAGALPERANIAHERLAHQYDPALTEALSQRELSAQRELAEKIRDYERGEQLARIEAAQSAADRVRRTRDQLADNEAKDLVRAAQAIAEQRRAASPSRESRSPAPAQELRAGHPDRCGRVRDDLLGGDGAAQHRPDRRPGDR